MHSINFFRILLMFVDWNIYFVLNEIEPFLEYAQEIENLSGHTVDDLILLFEQKKIVIKNEVNPKEVEALKKIYKKRKKESRIHEKETTKPKRRSRYSEIDIIPYVIKCQECKKIVNQLEKASGMEAETLIDFLTEGKIMICN